MIELLVAWLPLLVIIAVMIVGGVISTRSYSGHVARVEAMSAEMTEVNRQMLAELREIHKLLKDRN